MATPSQTGYYGKIPSKGDFISRHLPRSFVEPWDTWLQAGMAASQEKLNERWLDFYLTSPVWRFVLSQNACDEQAWAGVLIPSVDRVGRYFPFSIIQAVGPDTSLFTLPSTQDEWFSRLEALALSTLDKDIDIEALNSTFDELDLPNGISKPGQPLTHQDTKSKPNTLEQWHLNCPSAANINDSCVNLLEKLIYQQLTSFSVWWTSGSEHIEPCLLVSKNLPTPESFSALLDGQWQAQGWHTQLDIATAARPTVTQIGVESA